VLQVEAAAGSFVNLGDLVFEIVRADSQTDYASSKSLIGELVSNGVADGKKLNATQIQTRSTFHVK
jgi:hypothetical protein